MDKRTSNIIEALSAAFGVAGAWLIATQLAPALGFACFLASNVGWIIFSRGHRHWWLLVQQLAFTGSSLWGLWQWWVKPLGGA